MTGLYLMGFYFVSNATFLSFQTIFAVVLEMLQHAQCLDYLLKVFMLLNWQIKIF